MDPQTLTNPKIAELVRQAEQSRAVLLSGARTLKHRLDVPARVKSSLGENPGAWILGTAGLGLLASMFLRRRTPREPRKARGIPSIVLGLAATAAKPLVKTWLSGQLTKVISDLASRQAGIHPQYPKDKSF